MLSAGSAVGLAASAYLVNHYPLLLIALSPIGRHLILVVPNVDPGAFLLVAGLQQLHSDAAFLLRLTHQPVDHHLFTAGLLLGEKHMR